MRALLDEVRHTPESDSLVRGVEARDRDALAGLMLDAYRGTVDDEGEDLEQARGEVGRLLQGVYGVFDWGSSEVTVRDGEIVSATLVTEYEGRKLIAFSLTAKAWQRRGLARRGIVRVMHRLRVAGINEVWLSVTAANEPAVRLYESLGFEQAGA